MADRKRSKARHMPKRAILTPASGPIAATHELSTPTSQPEAKKEGKAQKVMALLGRGEGATLDELVTATGWQPHTTRAALTGLRKKGHVLNSEKVDGVRRYKLGGAR